MKKQIVKMKMLMLAVMCITACSNPKAAEGIELDIDRSDDSDMTDAVDIEHTQGYEEVSVNEEIDDNLFIQADIKVPREDVGVYKTNLKQFDCDQLKDILFDDPHNVTVSKDGEYISGDSVLLSFDGCLGFQKSSDIGYIDLLYSYAENHNELSSSDLEFETIDEAVDMANDILSKMDLGCSFNDPQVYSFSINELKDLQTEIETDEDYSGMIEAKNLVGKEFGNESGYYYLEYSFDLEGIDVFGSGDKAEFTGDFDGPNTANKMSITVSISENGIEEISIDGAVEKEELTEKDQIIGYDKIKGSILDYYADEILTCECMYNNFDLMYLPILDADSFTSVTLIPVWKCDYIMDFDGEEYEMTMYINAVNGDIL